MRSATSSLSCAVLAFLAACSSMSNGVVSIEARADSPAALEALMLLTILGASGEAYEGSASAGNGGTVSYGVFESDTFLRSAGFLVSINTPIVDLVGGLDRHWYEDQGVNETSIGLRKRFSESDSGFTYVQVLGRRGHGIDTDSGTEDYDGISIGIGCIAPIGGHWFGNIGLEYESTLKRIDVDGEDSHLSDLSLIVGLGFAL